MFAGVLATSLDLIFRSSHWKYSIKNNVFTQNSEKFTCVLQKKVILKISQNSRENTRAEACNFIKKETLAHVFSCEFC